MHEKQQRNVGFFIFKFTLKYMLGNVYINKIHARQCLYLSLYCREGLSLKSHFLKSPIFPPYQQVSHPAFSILTEMQL